MGGKSIVTGTSADQSPLQARMTENTPGRTTPTAEPPFLNTLCREDRALLASGLPLIHCSLEEGSTVRISFIVEESVELRACSPDVLSPWLPAGSSASFWEITRSRLLIPDLCDQRFVRVDICARIETQDVLDPVQLSYQIAQLLRLVPSRQVHAAFITTNEGDPEDFLRRILLKTQILYTNRFPQPLFEESLRLLLAADPEFSCLRSTSHLLTLIHSHYRLRDPTVSPEQRCVFRLVPAKLKFPFGIKETTGIVISLRSLSPYDRFDQRHILRACQSCIPDLEIVPQSFYAYRYPDDPAVSVYAEVGKRNGSPLSKQEADLLHRMLEHKLAPSIEQMVSRVEIPQNEEDVIRNFLLLSQQRTGCKTRPKVIVQFLQQTDQTLDFHVTLVRTVREGFHEPPVPKVLPQNILGCSVIRSSPIEPVGKSSYKQGALLMVSCPKEPFFRRDRSLDFLRAREAVVQCIESAFGTVYDFNGSLIYQQHQVLESLKPFLSEEESQDLAIAEDLFYSLSPSCMKNLLGPEHILTIFRQFLELRRDPYRLIITEEYARELFVGLVLSEQFSQEELFKTQHRFQFREHEFATCHKTCGDKTFCFVICVSRDARLRKELSEHLCEQVVVNPSQRLRTSLPRPLLVLDPRIGADRASRAVMAMLYEGLMRLDRDGNPVQALAEDVHISDDRKTYTFTLRPAVWSNGCPLTSIDFEYAWKRILDPTFHSPFAYLFHPIKNAERVKRGELPIQDLGVHARSDRVLVVELEHPAPYFLELCSLWIYSPLCQAVEKANPGWAYSTAQDYVCNGPFKLSRWCRKDGIQAIRNERYWNTESVALERIDLRIEKDSLQTVRLFERGELDWVGEPLCDVSLGLVGQLPKASKRPLNAVHWYILNTKNPILSSVKIRWAFSYAIDRMMIIQKNLTGNDSPARSLLPKGLSLLPDNPPMEYNLRYARKLFKEGLDELGLTTKSVRPLRMVLHQESLLSIASCVAELLDEAFGIITEISVISWNGYLDALAKKSFDIFGAVWQSLYSDPSYSLKIISDGTNLLNGSSWTSREVQALLRSADEESCQDRRDQLLREAERHVMEAMPVIPLFDHVSVQLKGDAVSNIMLSPAGHVDFTTATRTGLHPPA